MYYLSSSVVVVGVEDRPPFGDLGCALRQRPTSPFFESLKSVECLNSENPRGEWYCFPISIPPSPLSRADAVRCTIHLRLALSRQVEPSTKSEGRKQGSEGRGPADEKHRSSVLTNISTLREMLIRDQCNNEIELRELHQFFAQRHPRPRTCAHPTQPRLLE